MHLRSNSEHRSHGAAGPARERACPKRLAARSWWAGCALRILVAAAGILPPGSALPRLGWADEAAGDSGLVAEALEACRRGDSSEGIRLLERALEGEPGNQSLRRSLALAHFVRATSLCRSPDEFRFSKEAAAEMRAAISLDPERAAFHAWLGALCFAGGRLGEALSALERALVLDPTDASSAALLGEIAYDEGDLAGAVDRWEQARSLDPGNQQAAGRLAGLRREAEIERRFGRRERARFLLRYDGDDAAIRARVDEVLIELEQAYADVGRRLGLRPDRPIAVVVYTDADFGEVTGLAEGARGYFDGQIRVPGEAFRHGAAEARSVLVHEYTHAAVHQATGGNCPVWLQEGLAQLMAGEWGAEKERALTEAARAGALRPLATLETPAIAERDPARLRLFYQQSYAAARFLMERYGPANVARALRELGEGRTAEAVLAEVFGLDYAALDEEVARRIVWGDFRR